MQSRLAYFCGMNFQQRFVRYLVGIFIGVLVSFMLFGQRSCTNWLPGKRIRDFLTEQPIRYTESSRCFMRCYGLETDAVQRIISEGDIDYSQSEPRAALQRYYLASDEDDLPYAMLFELRDTATLVLRVTPLSAASKACDCE